MKNEEIKSRLLNMSAHAVHLVGERPFVMSLDDGVALLEAVDAVEKQIPKALTERQDVDIKNLYHLHCPTCDIPLGSNNKRTGMLMMFDPYAKCCSQCGQAMKVDTK